MVEVWVVFVYALIALIPVTLVVVLVTCAARQATITVGKCHRCQYDLHGLGAERRCPECGAPFVLNEHGDPLSGARVQGM